MLKADPTEEGVMLSFENMTPFTTAPVFTSAPIPFDKYGVFINSELQKIRGESTTFINETPIQVEHKGSYINFSFTNGDTQYKISKMKKSVYLNWFDTQYEMLILLISEIAKATE